jgi:hypothetical protein
VRTSGGEAPGRKLGGAIEEAAAVDAAVNVFVEQAQHLRCEVLGGQAGFLGGHEMSSWAVRARF